MLVGVFSRVFIIVLWESWIGNVKIVCVFLRFSDKGKIETSFCFLLMLNEKPLDDSKNIEEN